MSNSTDKACKLLNKNDYFSQKQDKSKWIVVLMFSSFYASVFFLPSNLRHATHFGGCYFKKSGKCTI